MSPERAFIEIADIHKTYELGEVAVRALDGVSLKIDRGEFVSLMGASGSGKTTLLNILGCLDRPSSGNYWLDGQEISQLSADQLAAVRSRQIGFVFQNFNLLPYATAFENVEIPMIFMGMKARARKSRAMELLDRVGLAGRASHKPSELSGGEMQRVAIARSLANNPRLILADEPTGNLDTKSGDEILAIFEDLWKQGHTLVVITHNPYISERAQKVIHLIDGTIANDEKES